MGEKEERRQTKSKAGAGGGGVVGGGGGCRSSLLGSLASRAEASVIPSERERGQLLSKLDSGAHRYIWGCGKQDKKKERNVPEEREEKERLATPLLHLSCTPLGEGTVEMSETLWER